MLKIGVLEMDNQVNIQRRCAIPLVMRTSGMVSRVPYHSTPGTKSGDVMVTVMIAGEGIYQNSRGRRVVKGGMLGLVTADDPGVLYSNPDQPYHHYYSRFRGDYAESLVQEILTKREDSFFAFSRMEELLTIVSGMPIFHRKELPEKMGIPEAELLKMLLMINGAGTREGRRTLNHETLMDHLQQTLSMPTDLDATAGFFGVSRSTLSRRVRAMCGMSFQKCHEKMKLEWASTLLQHPDFSVKDTALRAGFSDALYFSRVFKKAFGMSPTQWREKRDGRR